MSEHFEYYILNNRFFAIEMNSHTIVYWEDGSWHEECNLNINSFNDAERLSETQVLSKTQNIHPQQYVEEILEQDMLKDIYCP